MSKAHPHYYFIVQGQGTLPTDLLKNCWPYERADEELLVLRRKDEDARRFMLVSNTPPIKTRWAHRGWNIIELRNSPSGFNNVRGRFFKSLKIPA